MSRANGITRHEILTSLKNNGSMTAHELHEELGISQVAVRQHLSSLEAENMIAITVERRGLGRPSHRYRLTPYGDEVFPRHYEALSGALIDELRDWQGDEGVENLFARRTERLVHLLRSRMKDRSLGACVQELARFQTENGYMAEVVEGNEPGTFRIIQHNCAVCAVAHKYPQFLCKQEQEMLSQALGCAEVVRETYIQGGDHTCTYHIRNINAPDQDE